MYSKRPVKGMTVSANTQPQDDQSSADIDDEGFSSSQTMTAIKLSSVQGLIPLDKWFDRIVHVQTEVEIEDNAKNGDENEEDGNETNENGQKTKEIGEKNEGKKTEEITGGEDDWSSEQYVSASFGW